MTVNYNWNQVKLFPDSIIFSDVHLASKRKNVSKTSSEILVSFIEADLWLSFGNGSNRYRVKDFFRFNIAIRFYAKIFRERLANNITCVKAA